MSDHSDPPGIHRISLPAPGIGQVNAYLLTGERTTLVDTGPGTGEARAALGDGLHRLGAGWRDIEQIIITHPHADHYGLARQVAAESQAPVMAHPRAVSILANPARDARRTSALLRSWGRRQGIPGPILQAVSAQCALWGETCQAVRVQRTVTDGVTVRAGGHNWRVLHTAGHSSAHICLLRPLDGTLISGDHLLPSVISSPLFEPAPDLPQQRVRSGTEYLASLSRLVPMRIGTVLPGHGAAFGNVDGRFLLNRIAAVRAGTEEVYGALRLHPLTLWDLCQMLYPRVTSERLIFALSNVAGLLDVLAANGRIAFQPDHHGTVRAVALEAAALAPAGD